MPPAPKPPRRREEAAVVRCLFAVPAPLCSPVAGARPSLQALRLTDPARGWAGSAEAAGGCHGPSVSRHPLSGDGSGA